MLTTRTTHRTTIVAALACALLAVAAPLAAAQPADMHASVAQAAADARQKQDLRSADARDGALSARQQDLNHLRAGGYTPGSNALNTTVAPPLPGPPTWPVNPEPISPAPVVQASDTGGGLDWTTIALGVGGGLLVIGAVAGVVLHSRRVSRGHIAA